MTRKLFRFAGPLDSLQPNPGLALPPWFEHFGEEVCSRAASSEDSRVIFLVWLVSDCGYPVQWGRCRSQLQLHPGHFLIEGAKSSGRGGVDRFDRQALGGP